MELTEVEVELIKKIIFDWESEGYARYVTPEENITYNSILIKVGITAILNN